MKSLVDHHLEKEEELREELDRADTIQKVRRALKRHLELLAAEDGPYIQRRPTPQARFAKKLLGLIRTSLNILGAVHLERLKPQYGSSPPSASEAYPEPDSRPRPLSPRDRYSPSHSDGHRDRPAVDPREDSRAWRPNSSPSVGGLIKSGFEKVKRSLTEPMIDPPAPPPTASFKLRVDSGKILAYFHQALEMVDGPVEALVEPETEASGSKPGIEDHPGVLELLQNLLGDAHGERDELPEATRQRIGEIASVLRGYDITLKHYSPHEDEAQVAEYFDFEPSLDPEQEEDMPLSPALLRDQGVMLRGRVIKSQSCELSNDENR